MDIYFFIFSVYTFYAFLHESTLFSFFCFALFFFCTSLISFCNFSTFLLLFFASFILLKYSNTRILHLNSIHSSVYIGMRFHLYIFFTMFYVHSFFFSLCLFDVQLSFLNTCQKVINGVGWLDDRHGLSPILHDITPLFVYTDQLLCHCVFICSNVR